MNTFELIQPENTILSFDLEQAYNLFLSCLLLNKDVNGLGDWVYQTKEQMTKEEQEKNNLFARNPAILLNKDWDSFESWLRHYETADAYALVHFELEIFCQEYEAYMHTPLDPAALLSDKKLFLQKAEESFQSATEEFQKSYYEETWETYKKPLERQSTVVKHFQNMWTKYLQQEWEDKVPLLQEAISAFASIQQSKTGCMETIKTIVDRDSLSPYILKQIENAKSILISPSLHIGPYIGFFTKNTETTRLITYARIPVGSKIQSPTLSRSELLMRLTALADDNRLRILELAAKNREVTTQDVIDSIGLSQSSASRHLNQLTATGFLTVQPTDRIKRYTLVRDRFRLTFQVLEDYLKLSW